MHTKKQQSGFVLVLALVLLTVMTLVGVSSMERSSLELKASANAQQHHVAFNIAQSVLEFASSGTTNLDFQDINPQNVDTALLPVDVLAEAEVASLAGASVHAGCSVGVGSSLEEGKGLSYNFFQITGTASNKTGTAASIQGQGVRYPAAACN